MATGDSQLLPQRTRSLPRSQGQRAALRDLGWFRKPRSNTEPHQQSSIAETSPRASPLPRWQSSHAHNPAHPVHSHDASVPRVLAAAAAAAGRLAASESVRISQTVDLGSVLHAQALSSHLVHTAGFGHAGRHVESLSLKLMAADARVPLDATGALHAVPATSTAAAMARANDQSTASAKPAASLCGSGSAGGKSLERLLQSFPDVAADPQPLCDFVCSLDHAGIRWYGRIFIGTKCLFFTGTGISLGGGTTSRRSASTVSRKTPDAAWNISVNSKSVTSLASVATPQCSGRATLPRTATEATAIAAAATAADNGAASTAGAKKPWRRTAIRVHLRDITRVNKELTMGFWPNAITVGTTHRQYIFTNFLRRDRAHRRLIDAWQSFKARAAEETLRPASPAPTHRLQMQLQQRRANRVSVSESSVGVGIGIGICIDTRDMARRGSSTERCESESTVCETPGIGDLAERVCEEPSAESATEPSAEPHAETAAEPDVEPDEEPISELAAQPATESCLDQQEASLPLPPPPVNRQNDIMAAQKTQPHCRRAAPPSGKRRPASAPVTALRSDVVDASHSTRLFLFVSLAVFLLFSSIAFP